MAAGRKSCPEGLPQVFYPPLIPDKKSNSLLFPQSFLAISRFFQIDFEKLPGFDAWKPGVGSSMY
jgi:hypothetical protein